MQFAGQRTDENLQPLGEPDDLLIRLSQDVLPDPEAIVLTGITPQTTLADGLTEKEFLDYFNENISEPDTIFLGFNTVRFDDEFMRYLHYRNYFDPYEWQWKDGRSRWDMLDVVRMMRALRPDGLEWPVATDGTPTNRLESLAAVNGISHINAHTALADVNALIELAQKIRSAQPKLFDYLRDMRTKKKVSELVMGGQPFIYTSGSLDSQHEKTSVAYTCEHLPDGTGAIVFDARYSPEKWLKASDAEVLEALTWKPDRQQTDKLPFKTIQFNRCPAIAPLGVLDEASKKRLSIDLEACKENIEMVVSHPELIQKITRALMAKKAEYQTAMFPDESSPDTRLYDGFIPDQDKSKCTRVQRLKKDEIATFVPEFSDARMQSLWPLYKARNYPKLLSPDEKSAWEHHIEKQLFDGGDKSAYAKFLERLAKVASREGLNKDQQYVIEELKLYAESIAPY
jgi:exodeoxyribonuclease-1